MRTRLGLVTVSLLWGLSLHGCAGDEGPSCPAGAEGCACRGDKSCDPDLICRAGECRQRTCTLGEPGCSCFGNGTCLSNASGITYACVKGVCALPSCEPGNAACACDDSGGCAAGLTCDAASERCVVAGCDDGASGCACRADLSCNPNLLCQGGLCVPFDCTPGATGCACDDGDCQAGEAACDAHGLCQVATCPAGQEGCACASGACGHNSRGEQLLCEGGVCQAASCTPGATGCVCRNGDTCSAAADSCRSGFCQPEGCVAGELHCACLAGGCASGLVCRDGGVCMDGTGYAGGPCLPNNTCERGNRCRDGRCEQCLLGTQGCACDDAGACGPGLECAAGFCIEEGITGPVAPPERPRCYTPCERDLVMEDGTFRRCSAEGLMEGCVGDLSCTQGCCTTPGSAPQSCDNDLGCPAFQTCIRGQCYSNCDANTACPDGLSCYLQVCRLPCDTQSATCPDGYFCETGDGEFGHCMPVARPGEAEQFAVEGEYRLSQTAVPFSNVQTSIVITLTNNSPRFETFTLRKLSHTATFADGSSETFPVDANPATLEGCDPARDCPLFWLEMGEKNHTARVQEFEVGVDGNGTQVQLELKGAGDYRAVRWSGRVEVSSPHLPTKHINAEYVERPEGRWAGNIYYFAQFGDNHLAEWRKDHTSRNDATKLDRVGNAFVQKWGAFRTGNLSWDEFKAVLTATRDETWRWPSVKADCDQPSGACYMYDASRDGLESYTNDLISRPIPTGVVELPFAINLHMTDATGASGVLEGRIESRLALQYAGNPAFRIDFGSDPAGCESMAGDTCLVYIDNASDDPGTPGVDETEPLAQIYVGGRYLANGGACDQLGYTGMKFPWLIPGFERLTAIDPDDQLRKRRECRDTRLPFDDGSGTFTEEQQHLNLSLAASNPVPDGRTRRRTLKVVDGALINQTQIFIIFEETFETFLPGDDTFSAYGYMVLEREAADLDLSDANQDGVADVYEGSVPQDLRDDQPGRLDVACSPALLDAALDYSSSNDTVTADNVFDLVYTLLTGIAADSAAEPIAADDPAEQVHYLCADTGMFNGGRYDVPNPSLSIPNNTRCDADSAAANRYDDNGSCDDGGPGAQTSICPFGTDKNDCGTRTASQANARVACPAESRIVFFTVDPAELSAAQLAAQDCQKVADGAETGTCTRAMLERWRSEGKVKQIDPFWRCANATERYCDRDREDLRQGKTFYKESFGDAQPAFTSIYADIHDAFRYKTRFRSRSGQTLGFAPEICDGTSDQVPYCYDPAVVERIRERVDCLLYVWRDWHEDPALDRRITLVEADPTADPPVPEVTTTAERMLDDYLCANYAYTEACHPEADQRVIHDGFERLYAELLVMMGDEAYTQAFASRFDLAGSNARSFQGALFEAGGINLTGPAGFEMYSLYQATQYYQEALDRFYGMSPLIWQALEYGVGSARNFVTQATVTWYFDRLIRASTQKARAWSQIAQRYQNFNQPELARRVTERAYTATYLESVVLTSLMRSVTGALAAQDVPAVDLEIEKSQRRYRMALLDMRNVYTAITDDLNYFGFAPDYIPFPTLSAQIDVSAFEVIMGRAKNKLLAAQERENDALNRNRAFETDAEEFQAELVRLRTNYENQLGEVCGTFEGTDGRIYPAISTYADMNEHTRRLGDPCGTVGGGSISQSVSQYESYLVDLQRIRASFDNVLQEIEIERSRASAQCGLILSIADYKYNWGQGRQLLSLGISAAQRAISQIDRLTGWVGTVATLTGCFVIAGTAAGTDCPTKLAANTIFTAASLAGGVAIAALDIGILAAEEGISQIDLSTSRWETERQCDMALIDSNARMASLALRLKEIELEALRAQYQIQMATAELQRQFNLAKRLEQEMLEAEQFAINIQAARNDPNVRIYRNDAYLNADLSFKDALREAYRATKVFEYYTSQSYAMLEQLFLIRMVQYGDYNLSNYLTDLENEFYVFEEEYGLPDTRVAILSLRDDLLAIPYLDDLGRAYTKNERIDLMRARLADPSLLDVNGYLTIGFSTNFEALSPLTRNHKILYTEAEVIGSEVGDTVGRVYLRQQGTSVINGVTGEKNYYRFPERLAVVNPFFNGTRVFDKEIYRNNRMRDRPYVNTSWELILNQRDELANQDINLQSLTDVRVYVYYTDFTQF